MSLSLHELKWIYKTKHEFRMSVVHIGYILHYFH